MKKLEAVIFDMDGVLINSEPLHFDAGVMTLGKLGHTIGHETWDKFIGTSNTHIWNTIRENYRINKSTEELIALHEESRKSIFGTTDTGPLPGIPELLSELKKAGIKTAVASSSPYYLIELITGRLGIRNFFDELVSGDNVKNSKPAPDIFLLAAEKLGVRTENCVVIEDSFNGVKAANAAGICSIAYINPDSGNQDLSKAAYRIKSFNEISVGRLTQMLGESE